MTSRDCFRLWPHALVAALLICTACPGPEPEPEPEPETVECPAETGTLVLTLGELTGLGAFSPLLDGDDILFSPPASSGQGGTIDAHTSIAYQLTGTGSDAASIAVVVTGDDGETLGALSVAPAWAIDCLDDGFIGVATVYLPDKSDLDLEGLDVEVTLTASDLSAEVSATLAGTLISDL
ncbi:MAG: hypothetical protein QF464_22195 [Myxococcota bacterium]|nr:hypothetical protein [Myxococcota bacterium]